MYPDPWFLLAVVASFTGYAIYLAGLRRRLVEPNRASWLIWGSATLIERSESAVYGSSVVTRRKS